LQIDPAEAATQIVSEADRVREEMLALFRSLNVLRPNKAVMKRARELRERAKALGEVMENLLLHEMAVEIALRQRLGRNPVDGDLITPADEQAAQQILAGFRLC
jgi:hypothetical protein